MNMVRVKGVMKATGLSRASVYAHARDGLLPRPIKIGERASAWRDIELDAINAARSAGKSADEIRALVVELERQRTAA